MHRRRGIARALLSAAVEQAQSAGWTKLFLRVLEPNIEEAQVSPTLDKFLKGVKDGKEPGP